MDAPQNYLAVIKVVGIGGGGVNAVNRMIEAGLRGVEFIAVNTDAQTLLMSDAEVKLDIPDEPTLIGIPLVFVSTEDNRAGVTGQLLQSVAETIVIAP